MGKALDSISPKNVIEFVVYYYRLIIIFRKYLKEINMIINKSLSLREYNHFNMRMKKIGV
jgi:hypothetical protein